VRREQVVTVKRVLPPNECRNFWLYDVGEPSLYAESELVPAIPVVQAFDGPPPPRIPELRRAPATVKDGNPKDIVGATKVPLSLLSPIAKAQWALAQYAGLCKYGAWNWRAIGVRAMIYLDAIDRHRDAYLSGEEFDPVDGTHHLGNIMACCAILLDAAAAGKLIDDRPPSVDIRPTYEAVQTQMAKLREKYEHMQPRHYTIADTERADDPESIPHDDVACGAV